MFEFSVYSVISPEGCASILWRDDAKKSTAADAMRITAGDLAKLGIIDQVIAEPAGGPIAILRPRRLRWATLLLHS